MPFASVTIKLIIISVAQFHENSHLHNSFGTSSNFSKFLFSYLRFLGFLGCVPVYAYGGGAPNERHDCASPSH